MPGTNIAKMVTTLAKAASGLKQCVFISYRLADADVATSVGSSLTDSVGCNIYCSEHDADQGRGQIQKYVVHRRVHLQIHQRSAPACRNIGELGFILLVRNADPPRR